MLPTTLLVSLAILLVSVESEKTTTPTPAASERDLVDSLFKDYNKDVRPVRDYHNVLNVTIQPQIYSLIDVDELKEQIKVLIWFPQSWTDEFLQWEPDEWGGIEKVNVPTSSIWVPDGYIFNTVEMSEPLTYHNARIRYDGLVEIDFNKLVDVTCPMSILAFPFDEQLCSLQFGSWSYQTHQINFTSKETFVPKNAQNSEWDIIGFDAEKVVSKYENTEGGFYEYEEIFFRLVSFVLFPIEKELQRLRRKPLYYFVVIIAPAFFIVTVSNVGIFTPHGVQGDREEKVSLGQTTMLTMAVILDMVTSEMPKSSEGVPVLGKYVLVEFVVSIAATLVSVLIIFLHERSNYMQWQPPRWLLRFFNEELEPPFEIEEHIQSKTCETVEELRNCIQLLRGYIDDQETGEKIRIIWQRVFSWADLLSMAFFTVVNFLITYVMFKDYRIL